MLTKRIIPCLDIKDGRTVKGINFVQLRDAGDPVEQAKIYDEEGADELCFLDITASYEDRETIYDVISKTAENCFIPLTVGGGVREVADFRRMLLSGADKVSINSAAVADKFLLSSREDKIKFLEKNEIIKNCKLYSEIAPKADKYLKELNNN